MTTTASEGRCPPSRPPGEATQKRSPLPAFLPLRRFSITPNFPLTPRRAFSPFSEPGNRVQFPPRGPSGHRLENLVQRNETAAGFGGGCRAPTAGAPLFPPPPPGTGSPFGRSSPGGRGLGRVRGVGGISWPNRSCRYLADGKAARSTRSPPCLICFANKYSWDPETLALDYRFEL